ncbi:MAG: FHA domain-containing protein [Myxococcales bacterium]|nr:FHA domain-containing protein [Myxococcales bacterium]
MPSADPFAPPVETRLVWNTGSREESFRLVGSHRIGRHPANDIQLLDSVASKVHCRIERRGDAHYLRDLRSLNGTYLNGQRVRGECRLHHRDVIAVGSTTLRFEQASSPLSPDASVAADHRFVCAVGGLLDATNVAAAFTGALRVAIDLARADWGALILVEPAGMQGLAPITLLPGSCAAPEKPEFDVALIGQALTSGAIAQRVESEGNAYRNWRPRTRVAIPLVVANIAFGVLWLERQGSEPVRAWSEIGSIGKLAALVAAALEARLRGLAAPRPD